MNWKKGDKVEVKVKGRWVDGVIHGPNPYCSDEWPSMIVEIGDGQYRECVTSFPEYIRMLRDRFSTAVRRAYKNSAQGRLDALLDERRMWQRKQTIAKNKLAKVQQKLDDMLNTYVTNEMEKGKSNE